MNRVIAFSLSFLLANNAMLPCVQRYSPPCCAAQNLFFVQALSSPGDVFFHRGIGGRTSLAVVHLVVAAIAVLPGMAQGRTPFKVQEWNPKLETVEFKPYKASYFSTGSTDDQEPSAAAQVVAFMHQYGLGQLQLQKIIAARQTTPDVYKKFLNGKKNAVESLCQIPGVCAELNTILHSLNYAPASNAQELWDQYLHLALTRYLGARGVALLILPSGPVRPVNPMWTEQDFEMSESVDLFAIQNIESPNETISGQPQHALEVHLAAHLFDGAGDLHAGVNNMPDPLAMTLYQSLILDDPAIDQAAEGWHIKNESEWALAARYNQPWHPHILINGQDLTPLDFLIEKLRARDALKQSSRAHIKAWYQRQSRFHEFRHLADARRGRSAGLVMQSFADWGDYTRKVRVPSLGGEVDGRLEGALHALPEDKEKELLTFGEELVGNNPVRNPELIEFNLFRLMLDQMAATVSQYPTIRLFPGSDIPLRGQILAQLDQLSPEQLDYVWDEVLAYRETHPTDIQIPLIINLSHLYQQGPRVAKSPIQRILPFVELGLGVPIATIGFILLWQWYLDARRIKRNAEIKSVREMPLNVLHGKKFSDQILEDLIETLPSEGRFARKLKQLGITMKEKGIAALRTQMRQRIKEAHLRNLEQDDLTKGHFKFRLLAIISRLPLRRAV